MNTKTRLLVATTNQGKLVEYRSLLADLPVELLDLTMAGVTEEIPETGTTFDANARLKAVGYAQLTGMITLADDSGLEVAALNGEPGVYSARYGNVGSDTARNTLLLEKLANVPTDERAAQFVCVIAVADPAGPIITAEGTVAGTIAFAPRGTQGFGYDPLFLLERGLTMAELPPAEKNAISHRAVAAHTIRPLLMEWFTVTE